MSDFLLDLSANPTARQVIKALGLPLPLPQTLRRDLTPWQQMPLADLPVVVCQKHQSALAQPLAQTLARAGAQPWLLNDDRLNELYLRQGEGYGRLPQRLAPGEIPQKLRPHALLFDASRLESPDQLQQLYSFFHDWLGSLNKCGRVLVLARPPHQTSSPAQAATAQALEGFVRSVAREIGRKGSTAQLVTVEEGAEAHLEATLRFLLSYRAAYISGQPIHLSAQLPGQPPASYQRPLEGKIALVTGAARGIGASIARTLAREGARVIVLDLPNADEPASLLAQELHGELLLTNLTDPDAPQQIQTLLDERCGGKLDVLIHNAGVTRDKTLAKMDQDRWDLTLHVNLLSLIRLNEALLERFNPQARIVCLSSIAGIAGNVGQTNYATSKAGIIGYVRALAPVLAPADTTINAVAPGFIETQMTAAIPTATREVGRRLSNLSQGGLPEDVAEAITFLVSPGAAGITGQVLRVCGGNYLGA